MVAIDSDDAETVTTTESRRSLSRALGAEQLTVVALTFTDGRMVDLLPGPERVVVQIIGTDSVALDGRYTLTAGSIARLAPDRPFTIGGGDAVVLVVSAATDVADTTEPTILDLDTVEYVTPSTSDVVTTHLTKSLGCTGMTVNARILEPDQSVPTHVEGTQEELFVPFSESATITIGDERISTPRCTAVRAGPDTPRSARNGGTTEARWLVFGAPSTGGPTEWGSGASVVE